MADTLHKRSSSSGAGSTKNVGKEPEDDTKANTKTKEKTPTPTPESSSPVVGEFGEVSGPKVPVKTEDKEAEKRRVAVPASTQSKSYICLEMCLLS